MVRILALLVLVLSACASEGPTYISSEGEDVDALRAEAAANWSAVGVDAPSDYDLLLLDQATLQAACNADVPEGDTIGGCSFPGVVLLANDQDPERLGLRLTHELGHMLRGGHDGELDHAHLDCPENAGGSLYGNDVMCSRGAHTGTLPTTRDAAFVTRAGR